MYIASSTADSTCNKEKKKDPPEHSYLKQLQLSKKPVYENGISRDAQKNNFQRNPTIPCIQKDQIFMKKKKLPFSLYFQKASPLFSSLTRKSQQECNFFYITILRPSPVDKKKKKKTITTRMGMEQRTTTIIRQSGISRRLCTDHEVTDHVQLSFTCPSLSLSLSLSLYIYIQRKREILGFLFLFALICPNQVKGRGQV
jgi:hypothetical protein